MGRLLLYIHPLFAVTNNNYLNYSTRTHTHGGAGDGHIFGMIWR